MPSGKYAAAKAPRPARAAGHVHATQDDGQFRKRRHEASKRPHDRQRAVGKPAARKAALSLKRSAAALFLEPTSAAVQLGASFLMNNTMSASRISSPQPFVFTVICPKDEVIAIEFFAVPQFAAEHPRSALTEYRNNP